MKKYIYIFIFLAVGINAFAQREVFKIKDYVVDKTGTLTQGQKQELGVLLEKFEEKKGSQIVVAIVPTTAPEEVDEYSIRLAEFNGIGRKDIDDGVLLLIAKNDRKLRIEVGYGLEGAITDYDAKNIIEKYIVPEFKAGQFFSGVKNGVSMIMKKVDGEELPEPAKSSGTSWPLWLIITIVIGGFVGVIVLVLFLYKKLGYWKGLGVFYGGIQLPFVLLLGFNFSVFIGFSMFIWVVYHSITAFRRKTSGGSSYYYDTYSSSSSSYSGGSSSSGYSGGGGSFGGGGASGGW